MQQLLLTTAILLLSISSIWMMLRDKKTEITKSESADFVFLGGFISVMNEVIRSCKKLFSLPSKENAPEWLFLIGLILLAFSLSTP